MNILALSLSAALSAAPMVDVSPYAVTRSADGTLEYTYDLSAARIRSYPDAVATHGEEKVKAFLKALPKTTKVTVAPGTALDIGAGRGVETGKLALSFAGTSEAPIAADSPLGGKSGFRMRPALDPNEPHVLLSADAIAWNVQQLELQAIAAEETDTEALRRELWNTVLTRSLARVKGGQGDAREGALALAARVAAASSCLDRTRVAAMVRADSDVSTATDAEISKLGDSAEAFVAPAPWSWRPELQCGWVRMRALGQGFERSRAGTAAVLTFLDLLEQDAKLMALWQKSRARRDAFLGAPLAEPLLVWREKTHGAGEAIENLNGFIERMPIDDRTPPGLIALPVTPFGRFLAELDGVERGNAWAELTTAVQDKRVSPGSETFPSARDAALASLCTSEGAKALRFDGRYRERFQNSFTRLLGGSVENAAGGTGPETDDLERSELKVRLLVPPALEVEPIPELYEREATALERLAQALEKEGLSGLSGLSADGQRTGPVLPAAKSWVPKLRGLAALASPDAPVSKDLAEGRRTAKDWRKDTSFARDVREANASPVSMPAERQHAALVGVSRRELTVTFSKAPKITAAGGAFVTQPSEQRYIVPVLVSVGGNAAPKTNAMDRKTIRSLVDGAGRDAQQIENAFTEALRPH